MTKSLVGSGGIESLITLHGVLCAFLVSIALGNEPLVAPAAFHRANFYGALAKEQGFRDWIYEMSCPSGCSSWNVTVAPNVTVNVKYELQAGFAERLPGREGYLGPAYFNDPWLDIVTALLFPTIDYKYVETWFLANPDAYRCNANGVVFGASASMLFFTGLLANIAIYVSFVISPHDDQHPEGFARWKRIGLPVIGLNYLVLVMAICLMFSGSLYINLYNDPYQKQIYATYGAGGFFLITLFLLVMCFAVASIVAWRWSKHGLKETTMAAGDGAKTAEDRQL